MRVGYITLCGQQDSSRWFSELRREAKGLVIRSTVSGVPKLRYARSDTVGSSQYLSFLRLRTVLKE